MSPIPLGFLATAGAGGGANLIPAYELISTTLLTTGTTTVDLTSIPQTYKHLQIRYTQRTGASRHNDYQTVRFNGDTTSVYSMHYLQSRNNTLSGAYNAIDNNYGYGGFITGASSTGSTFGAGIIDILDYTSAKNKTVRILSGAISTTTTSGVGLTSVLWRNTSAISQLTITFLDVPGEYTALSGSRFSIYGIKGV